ncbi:hypothetical protein ACSBR2_023548 [Camellia fascicularis]
MEKNESPTPAKSVSAASLIPSASALSVARLLAHRRISRGKESTPWRRSSGQRRRTRRIKKEKILYFIGGLSLCYC